MRSNSLNKCQSYSVLYNMINRKQEEPKENPTSSQKKYQKVNAFKMVPRIEFFATVFVFLLQLVLYCIIIPKEVVKIDVPALYILLALNLIAIVIIIYDFFRITCVDTADRLLIHPQLVQQYQEHQLFFCEYCQAKVKKFSYHCHRCKRCTEDMDHHCVFLNCCIGGKNYQYFLRILFLNIFSDCVMIAQAIWILIVATSWSKWASIALLCIVTIKLLLIVLLLLFHLYLNFGISSTTVSFLKNKQNKKIWKQHQNPETSRALKSIKIRSIKNK